MAKIQNPQNEKGEKLATEIMVNNTITECLAPLENRLEDSFENINSGDQFISIDKINADKNEEGDFFKTTISANVTESLDDIDKTSVETNKLVTSTVLKNYVNAEINKAIEDRTVNITNGTDNIKIEYKDTVDGDGNPGTYTISVDSYSDGNYINIDETNTISVTNVTSNIAESEDDYLTTAASVREYVKNVNDNNTISDIIWNLNDLLVSCINDTDRDGVKWVQELLRFNANNNSILISIINYESIYNTSDIIEATEKWIAEALAENTKLSTDLAFRQDSFMTNQLFRLFFYNLDHKFGKIYGSDDSISRKFMKRGLTFKYLTKAEGDPDLNYPNEGFGKPRYKYITLRYRGKTIDGTDKPLEIDWDHLPTIANTVNSSSTADTFQMAKAWDVIDTEEYTPIYYTNKIDESHNAPAANAIHKALYGYETTIIPQTYNTVWDNITAGTQVANTGGFYFRVNQTITCNAIEIRQIINDGNTAFSSAYIKIWDKATGSLLSKSPNKTTLSGGEGDTWDIDEMTFLAGNEYLITFNDNNTSSQFSPGYSVRFNKMASNLGVGYGLLSSGTLNAAHEGICPKVILKTLIPGSTNITKIIPEGLYDKHQTHINDTFVHNNAIIDGLYDKTDNIVSYQEGLITYTDGTTEFKDISDSISAQAAFRTSSGITPSLVSFNTRPEFVDENGEPTSNRWYDNNYASKFDYEMDANAHSVAINESSSLGSLINGSWMFTRSGLTVFNDDINCLTNGTAMFFNSKNLNRFKSALPSLTVGQWMFKGCNLKEFKSKMPALSIAQGMFAANENLTTFNSLMPSLTIGIDMFLNCSSLTTFIVPPSSLKNLYYSRAMFKGCNNLNIFTGSLEALEEPYWMFNNCKLSLDSIKNIADTVKDYTGIYQDNLTHDFGPIGIDCLESEYDNSEFKASIDKIRAKGWSLSLQFNKSTQTLNLDEPTNAPTNILYVKKENLGETLNEYIDENLNTWALTYANKVYDLEGWTIFSSVEEAAEAWKLTPVIK